MERDRKYLSGYLSLATQFAKLPKTPYQYGVCKAQLSASNSKTSRDEGEVSVGFTGQ